MGMSYAGVFFFALALAAFSTGLYYIGISMGYLYLMMGVIISAAVLPATLTLLWDGQSWAAATFSPLLGFACSLTGWLVKAKTEFGELSVAATGSNMPMLVGNCVSLLSPIVFITVLTYCPPFKPQNYDWQSMKDIKQADDADDTRDEEKEQQQLLRARKIACSVCCPDALSFAAVANSNVWLRLCVQQEVLHRLGRDRYHVALRLLIHGWIHTSLRES